jgi:rare lipoprotein A
MFEFQAPKTRWKNTLLIAMALMLALVAGTPLVARAESQPLEELLENLVLKGSGHEPAEGFASYYASRFTGRRTTSGHRYNPDKMTAAHHSLPLGTVVRVVNPATKQEVHVTITDRCAKKAFHFIDLSRAAAKKIGLWGKGKIKVVIIPLLEERLEEPA